MAARYSRWLLLLVVCVAFGAALYKAPAMHPARAFKPVQAAAPGHDTARMQSRFASSTLHTQTHAASLIELKDGRIRAFWFAGSYEGAQDVEIRSAVFDPAHAQWGTEQTVAKRIATENALLRYVSKLGNPVPARAADGRLWLFYVTVSLGGWAGSSITAITSTDEGVTWSAAKRLVTSPFLNISTLVKGTPVAYDDGTLGLPVYHEFISKFGELLHLDKDGAVFDKQRLSAGADHGLQPVLLVQSANDALALMRYAGPPPQRVLATSTHDAGAHWSVPTKLNLPNPNAALTARVLADGRMVAVLNDLEQGRDALALMLSLDSGHTWKKIYQLEDQLDARSQALDEAAYLKRLQDLAKDSDTNAAPAHAESAQQQACDAHGCRFEFSYPYLIQAHNGDLHLVYTWNRSFIKHVWFNPAWLDARIRALTDDASH